jgi:hypothetical protein
MRSEKEIRDRLKATINRGGELRESKIDKKSNEWRPSEEDKEIEFRIVQAELLLLNWILS